MMITHNVILRYQPHVVRNVIKTLERKVVLMDLAFWKATKTKGIAHQP